MSESPEPAAEAIEAHRATPSAPWWSGVLLAFGIAALFAFVGIRATEPGENVATPQVEEPEPEPELPTYVPDLPDVPDLAAGPPPGPPLDLDSEEASEADLE